MKTRRLTNIGCGLVMKQDITQPSQNLALPFLVVVWWWNKILHNHLAHVLKSLELWFGDETRYYTTTINWILWQSQLWFGDETRYYTTDSLFRHCAVRCGLVMKQDITQQTMLDRENLHSCGLVMKQDITQLCRLVHGKVGVVVWWWNKILHNFSIRLTTTGPLWFGDETRYYTTPILLPIVKIWLWFGDETRYYTTAPSWCGFS